MNVCWIPLDDGTDFQVTVLPNRQRYLVYCRKKFIGDESGRLSGAGTAAKFMGYATEEVADRGHSGELVFYEETFTIENIAHECAHLVVWYFDRHGKTLTSDEEMFACLVGECVHEVSEWARWRGSLPNYMALNQRGAAWPPSPQKQ